jgi:hypothetical protein
VGAVATDFYPIAQFALTVVQQPHMVKLIHRAYRGTHVHAEVAGAV